MKTVPTVRLADTADAVVLPDLPEEVALTMADIAGAAREGLLAMSVAAGMAVMAAMFEAEITEVCGPKGKHDTKRAAVRHGTGRGSVTLRGRRVAVSRPRARTVDGHEVPLSSYEHFAAEDVLTQLVMARMLAGRDRRAHRRARERPGRAERRAGVQHAARPGDRVRARVRRPRRSRAQGRTRRVASLRRHLSVAVGFGETDFAGRKRLCTRSKRQ